VIEPSARERMNRLGREGVPFLFIVDFDGARPIVLPLDEVDPAAILYDVNGRRNFDPPGAPIAPPRLRTTPIGYERYRRAFDLVQENLRAGNSYLLNLTFPTAIEVDAALGDIVLHARAPYRLWMRDELVVFSPECFVTIERGVIASHPMKGTIDAALPDAEARILADEKEFAEHVTIVDLIRNDLGIVSRGVAVERFRYVTRVRSAQGELLQVSSRITGRLDGDYPARIGDIVSALLPAGSVTGAPKKKTVEIIKAAEHYNRGYYTGVFGVFDGASLDSAVMIRFIERDGGSLVYKSGGGITIYSDPEAEYRELIDKVYVPIV